MEFRFLGKTGLRVSNLGLGTMGFGGESDEKTSTEILDTALDAGINLVDTADIYQQGRSEEILGRALKGVRHKVILCTKAYFRSGAEPNEAGLSRVHIINALNSSLQRLQTDWIDVFYLHRFDQQTSFEDIALTLDLLVRSGKIRYVGVSNFAAWQIMKLLSIQQRNNFVTTCCIQPMYNLLKRQAEVEIFELAKAENLGIVSYSPLAAGALTGKYQFIESAHPGQQFSTLSNITENSQHRLLSSPKYALRYGETQSLSSASQFLAFAKAQNFNPTALAIWWARTNPAVSSVLLGARNVEQLHSQLKSLEINANPELREKITKPGANVASATDRSEEALENMQYEWRSTSWQMQQR